MSSEEIKVTKPEIRDRGMCVCVGSSVWTDGAFLLSGGLRRAR